MALFSKSSHIGISIKDKALTIVELTKTEKYKIVSKGRVELEAGTVVRGRIKDTQKLARAFASLVQGAKPLQITGEEIICGLPDAHAYTHVFWLPDASPKSIGEAVRATIPLSEDDLLYSYRIQKQDLQGARVLVFAASKEVVDEWTRFFSSIHRTVLFFDSEVFAEMRMIFSSLPKEPVCVVDSGGSTTTLSIYDEYGLVYVHSFAIAGDYFTRELAAGLKVSYEEAEKQKQAVGISEGVFHLVRSLETVLKEIRGACEYYRRKEGKEVLQLALVGGSSKMPGFRDYIEKNIELPIKNDFSESAENPALGFAMRGFEDGDPILSLAVAFEDEQKKWWSIFTK